MVIKMTETLFSKNLQKLRKERGVTQEQLASVLGVSPQAVSKWENGSYPEGDLLPKLADYFDVSIDYLYGRGNDDASFEQMVLNHMLEIAKAGDEKGTYKDYLNQMLNLEWAMQIGCWRNNTVYYGRPVFHEEDRMGAVFIDNEGYSFMSLSEEFDFFTMFRRPECGYENIIKPSKEIRYLLRILSEDGMMELLCLLFTLSPNEFMSEATIAKKLGMKQEKVAELFNKLRDGVEYGGLINLIQLVNSDHKQEKAYGMNDNLVGLLISLFGIAHKIMRPPFGYQMQVARRNKPWMDCEKLDYLKK